MKQSTGESKGIVPRWVYVLTPFFLLLLCLVLINALPILTARPSPALGPPTPQQSTADGTAVTTAIPATASPTTAAELPSPTAVPPTPTLPPDSAIILLGPPDDGRFRVTDVVSFYGQWPLPLADEQQMVLYIRANGQEMLLGALDEPNMGQAYRWTATVEALGETAVIDWFIRLQSKNSDAILLESEVRTLQILP